MPRSRSRRGSGIIPTRWRIVSVGVELCFSDEAEFFRLLAKKLAHYACLRAIHTHRETLEQVEVLVGRIHEQPTGILGADGGTASSWSLGHTERVTRCLHIGSIKQN